jgi:hypothetical protein
VGDDEDIVVRAVDVLIGEVPVHGGQERRGATVHVQARLPWRHRQVEHISINIIIIIIIVILLSTLHDMA